MAIAFVLLLADVGSAETRALLIGVSEYPNLARRHQLFGPKNDVPAMRDFLVGAGVDRKHIRVLADQVSDANDLPTSNAINREFIAQQSVSQRGDTVVLYFAGHGSQQPQPPHAPDPEPDGLDEIFLPRDVGAWNGAIGRVEAAIIDDEIGAHISALRLSGVNVIAIFDTCHAGDAIRSPSSTSWRSRSVAAAQLGVPTSKFLSRAVNFGRATRIAPTTPMTQQESLPFGYLLALYASAPNETTIEALLPRGSRGAKPRGIFTAALLQQLIDQGPASNHTPAELVSEVRRQYKSGGGTLPSPYLEAIPKRVSSVPLSSLLRASKKSDFTAR